MTTGRSWYNRVRQGSLPLAARQQEVLDLVCLGKTNAEIGAVLGIATPTAKNHVEACRRKLQASNKVLLVAKYLAPDRSSSKFRCVAPVLRPTI